MSDVSYARTVVVESTGVSYRNEVTVGPFSLVADEPTKWGGTDAGPNPYDFLLTALGTCTSMAIEMYARPKNWPLERVRVTMHHASIHASDCEACETREGNIDRLTREIELIGDLSEEQRQILLDVAEKSPVTKTLTREIEIQTSLAPPAKAVA